MDNQELCTKLLKADSEEAVVGILTGAGYWDDAWRPRAYSPIAATAITSR